ncbi:violaxanthin de-epoxidase chloroplast precursor [Tribonema minus]|uniref:Violaxanthin de-epoxidase chloroplast n=1 Tax=Tribonema minus TaxID=303371 RepID=A0A835ZCN5_9STRA|nr:violaxanthin de-epoxidase chloroplast precursor [Tribonema minus]
MSAKQDGLGAFRNRALGGAFAAAVLVASSLGITMPAVAGDMPQVAANEGKEIGVCVLNNCKKELGACLLNPKCIANLACIQTCAGKADETACQIKCGDYFENETVAKFNACAVSRKRCVPQKQDDNSYPVPPQEALVKSFDTSIFQGQWYISAGLNPIFDIFDCQVHYFVNPSPGQIYGKLKWRIKEPDGEFFTRDTVQRFIQDKDNPALLLNHDNEYLHYQDDWYILDAVPDSHVLVYYRGQNDAWTGYGGAVLYTRDASYDRALVPRLEAACKKANIKWSDFQATDNSCKPQTRDPAELRAEYSKKLLDMEGQQLGEQLTALRGFAVDSIQKEEKDAGAALKALEDLAESYQNEIAFDALELQDTLGQEFNELKAGAEAEAKFIKEEVKEIERAIKDTLQPDAWKLSEGATLERLEQKLGL